MRRESSTGVSTSSSPTTINVGTASCSITSCESGRSIMRWIAPRIAAADCCLIRRRTSGSIVGRSACVVVPRSFGSMSRATPDGPSRSTIASMLRRLARPSGVSAVSRVSARIDRRRNRRLPAQHGHRHIAAHRHAADHGGRDAELTQEIDHVSRVIVDARVGVRLVDRRAAEAADVRSEQAPAGRQRLRLPFPHCRTEWKGVDEANDTRVMFGRRRIEKGDRTRPGVNVLTLHAGRSYREGCLNADGRELISLRVARLPVRCAWRGGRGRGWR